MALPTVDFLTWAIASGANVESQADYAVDPAQQVGVSPGLARSALFNKSQRQSAFVTSTLAMLMAAVTNNAILDDGDQNEFWKNLWECLLGVAYFVDTGTASAMVVAAPESLAFDAARAGVRISLKVAHTVTGPTTLAYMGHSPAPVVYTNGDPIADGDILIGSILELCFDGTSWQVVSIPSSTTVRIKLQTATDYYVDFTSGSDSTGDGTSGLPWKTLQFAYDYLQKTIDGGEQTVTVHQVAGVDTTGLICNGSIPGVGELHFIINGGINTSAAQAILAGTGAFIDVSGSGTLIGATWDIVAYLSGVLRFAGCTLGVCTQAKISAQDGGTVVIAGSYTDDAGASASHLEAGAGTVTVFPSATITQTGAVYTQFAYAFQHGGMRVDTITFAGTPSTGQQYNVGTGSGIFRNGTALPGTGNTVDAVTYGWYV